MFDNLNWPKNVPKEFYWEAMESIQRQRIRDLKAAKAYHDGMDKLKAQYQQRLHELIGSDKLKRYQKLHNARLHKLRKAAQTYPDTPEKLQEREALRLRLVKESRKTIDRSGVNLAKVKTLRDSYEKKVTRLFDRTVGKGKTGELIPRPKNIDYYPPYLLDARYYDHYESEDSLSEPSYTLYFDGRTGDFGSRTRIHVSGGDSWDVVSATCRTGFLLLYPPNPHDGLPRLDIDLEVVDLYYQGHIRNECWASSASVCQWGRLFGQVYMGSGEADRTYYPRYLFHNHRSSREDNWSETVLPPGSDFTPSFTLSTPIPANTPVLIGVGVLTFNTFLSDDCGIDSALEVRFLARRIGVTTTS
jgi:hypothetical protein